MSVLNFWLFVNKVHVKYELLFVSHPLNRNSTLVPCFNLNSLIMHCKFIVLNVEAFFVQMKEYVTESKLLVDHELANINNENPFSSVLILKHKPLVKTFFSSLISLPKHGQLSNEIYYREFNVNDQN